MKSNVSNQLDLVLNIYKDACTKCSADVSDIRDLETMRSRVLAEGLSFLTITLPRFANDFERSLQNEYIDSTAFQGFRKAGAIPAFLSGMLSRVFDHETGRIFNEQHHTNCDVTLDDIPTIVDSVRQICLAFKKVRIDCTPARESAALQNFIDIELSFNEFLPHEIEQETESDNTDAANHSVSRNTADLEKAFRDVSFVLWNRVVGPIDLATCNPQHGPGATAERISGNQKFNWTVWHDRLEPYFPLIGNAYPLGTPADSEELDKLTILDQSQELPVRVTPVPKTLKGPRIIAIEPACMQFVQQGIRDVLYDRLESHPITSGHVNFRDQSVNQELALMSSKSGRLVTIDLSDASDRVPLSLALAMFDSNPDLRDAINACRSTSAEMPDGTIVTPLRKFASMGSALCFPVEAMYFYTLCVMAILREADLPVTYAGCFEASRGVYVYGDDIVVPTTFAESVLDYLRKYNCKVNTSKTFTRGDFRESCGVDAFRGQVVTPTYLRETAPKHRRDAVKIISWAKTANLFYKKGYWRTSSFMFKTLERLVGVLPYVSEESSCIGRISFLGYRSATRWNGKLQRLEVKGLVPTPVYRTGRLVGYAALAFGLGRTEQRSNDLFQIIDSDPLAYERYALHGSVTLRSRWVPAT